MYRSGKGLHMTENGLLQIILYLLIVILLVRPLGWYMARVFEGKACGLDKCLGPLERFFYRAASINPKQEIGWKKYLTSMLWFNLFGTLLIYGIQRLQFYLPLNPQGF